MSELFETKKPDILDKMDKTWVGILVGLLVPLLSYFVIYLVMYSHLEFSYFFEISRMKNTAPGIIRTMVFANLPIFLLGNIIKRFLFCKGIFISSILYIMIMLAINYL